MTTNAMAEARSDEGDPVGHKTALDNRSLTGVLAQLQDAGAAGLRWAISSDACTQGKLSVRHHAKPARPFRAWPKGTPGYSESLFSTYWLQQRGWCGRPTGPRRVHVQRLGPLSVLVPDSKTGAAGRGQGAGGSLHKNGVPVGGPLPEENEASVAVQYVVLKVLFLFGLAVYIGLVAIAARQVGSSDGSSSSSDSDSNGSFGSGTDSVANCTDVPCTADDSQDGGTGWSLSNTTTSLFNLTNLTNVTNVTNSSSIITGGSGRNGTDTGGVGAQNDDGNMDNDDDVIPSDDDDLGGDVLAASSAFTEAIDRLFIIVAALLLSLFWVGGWQGMLYTGGKARVQIVTRTLLPQVLSFFLKARSAPEFMVSYAWPRVVSPANPAHPTDTLGGVQPAHLAQALVQLLPNTWIDREQLVLGDDIELTCASAVSHARVAILLVTPYYLQRQNACVELLATLQERAAHNRLSVVLMQPDAFEPISLPQNDVDHQVVHWSRIQRLLEGVQDVTVVPSVPHLISWLHTEGLQCKDEKAVMRTIKWWRRYGDAKDAKSMDVKIGAEATRPDLHPSRLVSAHLVQGQRFVCTRRPGDVIYLACQLLVQLLIAAVPCLTAPRLYRSSGHIYAGFAYLSLDARSVHYDYRLHPQVGNVLGRTLVVCALLVCGCMLSILAFAEGGALSESTNLMGLLVTSISIALLASTLLFLCATVCGRGGTGASAVSAARMAHPWLMPVMAATVCNTNSSIDSGSSGETSLPVCSTGSAGHSSSMPVASTSSSSSSDGNGNSGSLGGAPPTTIISNPIHPLRVAVKQAGSLSPGGLPFLHHSAAGSPVASSSPVASPSPVGSPVLSPIVNSSGLPSSIMMGTGSGSAALGTFSLVLVVDDGHTPGDEGDGEGEGEDGDGAEAGEAGEGKKQGQDDKPALHPANLACTVAALRTFYGDIIGLNVRVDTVRRLLPCDPYSSQPSSSSSAPEGGQAGQAGQGTTVGEDGSEGRQVQEQASDCTTHAEPMHLYVFFLRSAPGLRAWLNHCAKRPAAWPQTHMLLVIPPYERLVSPPLVSVGRHTVRYMAIMTGPKHGVTKDSIFDSLSHALTAGIAQKVGHVILGKRDAEEVGQGQEGGGGEGKVKGGEEQGSVSGMGARSSGFPVVDAAAVRQRKGLGLGPAPGGWAEERYWKNLSMRLPPAPAAQT